MVGEEKKERRKKKEQRKEAHGTIIRTRWAGGTRFSETQQTQTHEKQTTDRQTDKQTGWRTNRQTDRQTDRQIDKQIDREIGIVNNGRFSVIRCCFK